MRRHINYLKYLIRHKAFVFYAGWKIRAPLWRLIVHDFSKVLPCEWLPYARCFYNEDGSKREWASLTITERRAFDRAWLHHLHANPHHHQHWVLREDSGEVRALPIPDHFVRECIADWAGAGRAITGKWEFTNWYEVNKGKMVLHPETRHAIEVYLARLNLEING